MHDGFRWCTFALTLGDADLDVSVTFDDGRGRGEMK